MMKNSLLFSNVHLHSYSQIEESVILPNANIGRNCLIKKSIIDRGCEVPEGLSIGVDHQQDISNGFRISAKGIVLVTRDMLIALANKPSPQVIEHASVINIRASA